MEEILAPMGTSARADGLTKSVQRSRRRTLLSRKWLVGNTKPRGRQAVRIFAFLPTITQLEQGMAENARVERLFRVFRSFLSALALHVLFISFSSYFVHSHRKRTIFLPQLDKVLA